MMPAEELAAAADKLDALTAEATPDMGAFDDIEDVLFPEDLAYIQAMNPLVGKALAELMRSTAGAIATKGEVFQKVTLGLIPGTSPNPLVEIARLINGTPS